METSLGINTSELNLILLKSFIITSLSSKKTSSPLKYFINNRIP